ncbi:MAG: lipoyl synthase [Bacteroidales bacterium]
MKKHTPKPEWLKIKLGDSMAYAKTSAILQQYGLNTICVSGKCPNQGECWSRGTATFMIGGDVCTRSCKFCNTKTGRPLPLDPHEPAKLAEVIGKMGLKHAVITSVDRDDLPDLGANHWVKTVEAVREVNPRTTLEVLIPDFQGREELIAQVVKSAPDIISHNIETVRRLTPEVRSAAKYDTTLRVIAQVADSGVVAKSGLMLGLGEEMEEVYETLQDLLNAGCSVLTLGQYLQPTRNHLPVQRYVEPFEFEDIKRRAELMGFGVVESGSLVRSSYHAENHIKPKHF